MYYVITAFNKLTGERVTISAPLEKEACRRLRDSYARMLHRYSVYKDLRVEAENLQLSFL